MTAAISDPSRVKPPLSTHAVTVVTASGHKPVGAGTTAVVLFASSVDTVSSTALGR